MRIPRLAASVLFCLALTACHDKAVPSAPAAAVPAPVASAEEVLVAPAQFSQVEVAVDEPAITPIDLPEGFGVDSDSAPEVSVAAFKSMLGAEGLRYVYGDGERKLIVFSDPASLFDLAFFQMLEENKDNLNATVYVFPYAPESSPASVVKAQQIYCSREATTLWTEWSSLALPAQETAFQSAGRVPEAKWQEWVKTLPTDKGCYRKAHFDQIQALGRRLGIEATPKIVFAHGQAWPGPIISRDDLEKTWWYVHGHLKVDG